MRDVRGNKEDQFKVINNDYSPGYIKATYTVNDNFCLILDSDKVFSVNEIISIGNLISEIKG